MGAPASLLCLLLLPVLSLNEVHTHCLQAGRKRVVNIQKGTRLPGDVTTLEHRVL
jgi:hypothetical protein